MSFAYRADQVGSFLRPAELLDARHNPAIDPQRLQGLEDQHIQRVLSRQEDLGFEIFTDGELRRRNFMSDFFDAVEGFDMAESTPRSWELSNGAAAAPRQAPANREQQDPTVSRVAGIVTSRLRQVRRLTGHELGFLKKQAP